MREKWRKLEESDIAEIKTRLFFGESKPSIARCFGVHKSTIYDIEKGRTWFHI